MEWKRLEEEKVQLVMVMKSVTKEAVESAVDREQRILLQVSFRFLWLLDWKLTSEQKDLEALVMMPEPLLVPFTEKGKEVSFLFFGSGVQN